MAHFHQPHHYVNGPQYNAGESINFHYRIVPSDLAFLEQLDMDITEEQDIHSGRSGRYASFAQKFQYGGSGISHTSNHQPHHHDYHTHHAPYSTTNTTHLD